MHQASHLLPDRIASSLRAHRDAVEHASGVDAVARASVAWESDHTTTSGYPVGMTAIPASRADLRGVAQNVVESFRRDRLMTSAAAIA